MILHHFIQLLALPLIVLVFAINLKNRLARRLLTLALFSAALLLAIVPELCGRLASLLGCTHSLSPLLYLLTVLACCIELARLSSARQHQEQLTEIVRKTALSQAEDCSRDKK